VSVRKIEQLQEEIAKRRRYIESTSDRAADENRDLTQDELATFESMNEEVVGLRRQLDVLAFDLSLSEETSARLSRVSGSVASPDFQYRSAGQLLWDCLHQGDPDAKMRYGRVMKRVAEHMGTDAALTTPVAGDLGGLVVQSVVGPVSDPYPKGMPFANSVGMRGIPASDGFGFSRPHIVDPGFTTGVAPQALQKGELASTAFSIESDTVALSTVGGYLNVSQQLLAFQPSSLQIIVDQMRRRLENYIEVAMVTEMQLSTGYVALAAGFTAADLIKAIYDAAAAYYAVTYELPDWIAMGPVGWALLGGTTDLAGRPLFPTLGAANAPGSASATSFSVTVAGLQPIVTPAITDDAFYVGGGAGLEGYLYRFPVLEAVEPSVLGRQVALAASVAGFRPTPFADATIKIAAAP
jgi:HK97 family phage major capsid protein